MSTWLEYNFVSPDLQKIADELEWEKPLHMTLLHFPRNIPETASQALERLIDRWTDFFPDRFIADPLGGPVNFDHGAAVQRFDIPTRIWEQRQFLQQELYWNNIKWSNDYDWNPHVTIGWKKVSNSYYIAPITILAVTLHHNFGDPIKWWLKP